jgi:apolipoprotein N-acyltransferase
MAYPPVGQGWLVVPGIVGLLVALRGQHGTRARMIGLLHGMVAYGVGLSWLFQIFGPLVVMLWCVLAAFTALFAEMQSRALRRGIGGWRLILFTAVNWCGWEFIRAELFPLKFPWMTAGLAVGPNGMLPWIGVYGVSAIAVLLGTGIAMRKWRPACGFALILLVSVIWSLRSPAGKVDDVRTVMVGGIQLEAVMFDEFLKATKQLPPDVQYVVWPEYALPYDVRTDSREWNLLLDLCRERGVTMTIGTQSRPVGSDDWRNIALTMDAEGARGEHNKVHTVHFFDDGNPGATALPIQTAHGNIGTPVCFDCDYEGVVRKMTAAGAEMFIVPIMDAKLWTARQHEQHAELFRIRACENGRWMFVCATSGVSQVIDLHGKVHGRLPVLENGTLIGRIRPETKLTFYTRFGWLTPWCVLAVAAVCWLILLLPCRRRPAGTLPT